MAQHAAVGGLALLAPKPWRYRTKNAGIKKTQTDQIAELRLFRNRNDRSLNAIRRYIANNPRNWEQDIDNPINR
jgi:hypothetical protein